MPTTFANTINGNEILAKRSQCDYAGNDLQTTYATKSEVTTGLSSKEDSANKAQSINTSSTTDYPSSKATADFVNSSVATNTAKFLGNFTLSDLSLTYPATDAQIETALDGYAFSPAPTNNDYVYVEIQDPQTPGVTDVVKRFKYDGANWLYEYSLNNSSFTAQEIAAIDSGITSTKVGNYDNHLADTTIHVTSTDKSTWDAKQDAISDLATIRSGAQAGATAVQPSDLATVATSGLYSDLSGTPTIPPALSAGNGIDITNDTVSVDLDGTSLTNGANGLSVTLPVPDTTGASQGDVLSVGQSGIEWVTPGGGGGDDAVLTYNVSTWSDFTTAYNAGKNIRVAETVDGTTYEAVLFEYNPNGSPHGYAKFTSTILRTGVGAVSSNWYQISNIDSGVWTHGAGTVQGNYSGQGAISVDSSSHIISLTLDGSSLTQSSSGLAVANPLPSTLGTAGQVLQVNSGATSVEWATPSCGSVTDVEVDGVSVVSQGVASITMPTVDQTYDGTSTNAQSGVAVASAISTKQDTISDLATIRSGAADGATAVQPGDLATVATSGLYSDLSGTPTINNVPAVTSSDDNKVLKASYTGGVGSYSWEQESGGTVTDVEVDGVSVVSQGVASITMPTVDQTYNSASTNAQSGVAVAGAIAGVNQVPSSTSADEGKILTVDSSGIPGWVTGSGGSTGLFEAVYGVTTYADIVQAISDKKIVYCRVSPSGASRMAFLAYIGSSNVEFQYYRSLSSHSASNMTDEVYVYTVSSSGWTTTTRKTGVKVTAGTHMSQSYSNDTLTLNATWPTVDQTYDGTSANAQSGTAVAGALANINQVPASTSFDSGKVLTVDSNGDPGWVTGGGGGGVQSDWTEADPASMAYIQNKPTPKTLTAGGGIAVTESASAINVSADVSALSAAQIQSLKEALGVDETVLYSGMATIGNDGVATYQLSESPLNFQYIKVYFCANDNTFGSTGNVGSSYTEWDTQIYTAPSTLLSVYMDGNASASALTKYAINCDVSGIQTSTWSAQGYLNDATGNAKWFHIFKIVGRHRIANN